MTEEQYKKYTDIKNEIKSLKNFLSYCGNKYRTKMTNQHRFSIKTFKSIKDKFFLYEKNGWGSMEDNTYEIPQELQKRIIEVVERYVEEKEKEMENI